MKYVNDGQKVWSYVPKLNTWAPFVVIVAAGNQIVKKPSTMRNNIMITTKEIN